MLHITSDRINNTQRNIMFMYEEIIERLDDISLPLLYQLKAPLPYDHIMRQAHRNISIYSIWRYYCM